MRLLTITAALFAMPALAEPPAVIADIPATGSMVQQVMGDLGEVRVLLPAGGNVHHHQLRPSDAAALQDAGLLVWVGPALTPWLERSASTLNGGQSLVLLDQPDTNQRDFAEAHHDDHDDHHHDDLDPHAWLDPENGKAWLSAIAEALSVADPENAATYALNAKSGIAELDQVTADLTALLEPAKSKEFVVFHDAYGYFTESFDLRPGIAVAIGDASTPSAARLTEIRAQVQEHSATCAFPEIGHDPALIDSLTQGTAIRIGGELDPSGAGQQMGPQLYPALLRQMGETLSDCLTDAK